MLRIFSFLLVAGLAPVLAPAHAQNRAWTGELRPAGSDQAARPDDAPTSLEDVDARLAAIQLTVEAERDFEGARTGLEELWMQVARLEPFPGQAEALVRVALARGELLERLGELEAAREALTRLLPMRELTSPRGTWLAQPASPELVQLVGSIQTDARLVAGRGRLEDREQDTATNLAARPHFADPRVRKYVEAHFGLPSAEMDQLVLEQGRIGIGNVQGLGMRAAPTMVALTLSDLEASRTSNGWSFDPLYVLLTIDPLGAAVLVADHIDAGGKLWRLRIFENLRALSHALDDRPEWDAILAALFRDPQWRPRVLDWVERQYGNGSLDDSLVEVLSSQAASPDSTSQSEVYQLMAEREEPVRSARPVYVSALSHPHKSLRKIGAQHLLNLEETALELRRFASSSDSEERRWAVDTLLDSKHALDASERSLLSKFLHDPEASVRRRAVSILVDQVQPFPAEVYVEAASDEDPDILRKLAFLKNVDGETQLAVLLRLADSTSRTVLQEIDNRLRSVNWQEDTLLLPVLEKRFVDPVHLFSADNSKAYLQDLLDTRIAASPEGRRACVRMGLASGREEALHAALDNSYGTYSNGNKYPKCEALLELEPDQVADFFEWAHHQDLSVAEELTDGFLDLEGTPLEGLEALARNPRAHRVARVQAATIVVGHAPERGQPLVQEILHDKTWTDTPPYWRESRALRDLAGKLPDLSDFVLQVLEDPELADSVALAVLSDVQDSIPLTDELAFAILNRWLRLGVDESVVDACLAHLETMDPGSVDPALVIRAAYLPRYAENALRVMGTLRHAEYLPVLERALQGRQYLSPEDVDYDDVRRAAIESLMRYLSDDAARILVEGLAQANGSIAERIRSALTVIRDYHEERGYWERQSAVLPSRDEAIAELLAMLDAPEDWIRADAAKGLASFGALEAIPRLIRLRSDESEVVMAAASRALERLYSLAEHEQASAAGD